MKTLLVAGHGIRLAKAQEELYKVLELGIPVVTTFNGFDLVPNDHPCFVGRIGTLGTPGGNHALNTCDTLFCVGTRNNIRQIGWEWDKFAPQSEKIVCDIDYHELRKYSKGETLVNWDAKFYLKNYPPTKVDPQWLKELKDYNDTHDIELTPPYKFIRELTQDLPNDTIVVCGNGTACVAMFQAGIVKKGQRIFWNSGCSSMGYDLPAAIGACVASGKPVICITGDGSIMMNLQELQTISHYKLPIKIYVLNNNGYRSIELTQTNYFKGDFIGCNKESGVSFPDFKKLGEVFGVDITVVDIGNDYVFQKGLK
jgi:acetolactate synthase-1/2/3 large subunit